MNDYQIKAEELINRILYTHRTINERAAKELAIITVDQILKNIDATILYHKDSKALPINKDYWAKVKTEINKL